MERQDAAWRAAELQRRIGNRRRAALAAAGPTAPTDVSAARVVLPPLQQAAKRELLTLQMDVLHAQDAQKASTACATQQFAMERALRGLETTLGGAQKTLRLRLDRLDDMQTRVLRLSKALHAGSGDALAARAVVATDEQLRRDRCEIQTCPRCGQGFLPTVMQAHQRQCDGKELLVSPQAQVAAHSNQDQSDEPVRPLQLAKPRFLSQPPRNVRVAAGGVTHSTISLEWDAPIFTGSTSIVDFELRFSVRTSPATVTGDSTVSAMLAPAPPMRLSRWCLKHPVPGNQFNLTWLSADQEYGNFTIAAITKNGTSAPSNCVGMIRTAAAIAPSKPLFVTVGVCTASTIALSWTEPMDSGGVPIVDYEIEFVEAIMQETITQDKSFLNVAEVVYRPRRQRTKSSNTSFTIASLLSGKEHKQFRIRAINSASIPGDSSEVIETISTIAPGKEFKLLDELQAAVNARTRIVDSQFLSGFMQRYERNHYIELVSRLILSVHPELESQVAAIRNQVEIPVPVNSDPMPAPQAISRPLDHEITPEEIVLERRRQFHFRIDELEHECKRVAYNVQWCHTRRVDLVALIRAADNRIHDKMAELERARMFKGPQMDSDVLENGLQRFYTKELVVALEDEVEIEHLYVVDTKSELVEVENMLRADQKLLAAVTQRLDDRKKALAAFEANPSGTEADPDPRLHALARFGEAAMARAFCALAQNRRERKQQKQLLRKVLGQFVTFRVRAYFAHWRQGVLSRAEQEARRDIAPGIGSVALEIAAHGRHELLSDTQKLLLELRQVTSNLNASKLIDQPAAIPDAAAHQDDALALILLEIDAKMDIASFEEAQRLIQNILTNDQWMHRLHADQVLDLQMKNGQALFRLCRLEQALVYFNRASILASRGEQPAKIGMATLYIAQVHFALQSFRPCIDHYERALLCFEADGDKNGALECHRGLESAYSKLEDAEQASLHRSLGDEIEFALHLALSAAKDKLDSLQQRLVGIGAESSKVINLERVAAIVPRLRKERLLSRLRIREEEKWIASLTALLTEKKALLEQGEQDLKRALASDAPQVDSSVMNAAGARYEIEDFKHKLAKLMGSIKVAESRITSEIANARVRISNAEDEIKELEAELTVETGALMRRMISKERLRCFRFNATNEALENVIGTASHGISTCVASAGLNGLLFDLLSGACLHQAVGDPLKQHLGDPLGHQAAIVCLYYVGHRVYTGSMDKALGVWNVVDQSPGGYSCALERLVTVFDAAVVSVTANEQWIICGCSDCSLVVLEGQSLAVTERVIDAHNQSPLTLAIDTSTNRFTTSGPDCELKVWLLEPKATIRRKVRLLHTLVVDQPTGEGKDLATRQHRGAVTVVRQVGSEIVSGDSHGRVAIWNLELTSDQKLLRSCDAHQAPVVCLQFDALKIVSGASDGHIGVTDFATGQLLQTLVAHPESLLDLQFDRKRMISMSMDGTIRLWYWQTRMGADGDRKKYHILGAGETLKALSLLYRTSIANLEMWNHVHDASKLYVGQKMIVGMDCVGDEGAELASLDTGFSVQFGKAAFENLDFLDSNKAKSEDVETQWVAQRLALLAKEYFPEDKPESEDANAEEANESDEEDLGMVVDEEEAGGASEEGEGDEQDGSNDQEGEEADDDDDKDADGSKKKEDG